MPSVDSAKLASFVALHSATARTSSRPTGNGSCSGTRMMGVNGSVLYQGWFTSTEETIALSPDGRTLASTNGRFTALGPASRLRAADGRRPSLRGDVPGVRPGRPDARFGEL